MTFSSALLTVKFSFINKIITKLENEKEVPDDGRLVSSPDNAEIIEIKTKQMSDLKVSWPPGHNYSRDIEK